MAKEPTPKKFKMTRQINKKVMFDAAVSDDAPVSYQVLAEKAGTRVDKLISDEFSISRSKIQLLIEKCELLVNGKAVSKNYKVNENDTVTVAFPEDRGGAIVAEFMPIDIVYEDDSILVVNKPAGMVVHPGAGNLSGTLVNRLVAHCGENLSCMPGEDRPGIVHRIDKETSGLLVVAKTDQAYISLSDQMRERSIVKKYHCIVYGRMREDEGRVDIPIARHPVKRTQMAAVTPEMFRRGDFYNTTVREALTLFKVIKNFRSSTYLEVDLRTGRTHQIRVHMAYLGYPVAGDRVYNPKFGGKERQRLEKDLSGQCLHAKKLGLVHPVSLEYMEFESPLPLEFKTYLEKLEELEAEGLKL